MHSLQFEAIGTHWQIDISQIEPSHYSSLTVKIHQIIDDFDKVFSRFREDSLVTHISKKTGTFSLEQSSLDLFKLYFDFYNKTNGLFTPLIGQALSDAGYDKSYSLKPKRKLITPPNWVEVISLTGNKLTILKPSLLDFGAAGKGFLIDLVGKLLEENNVFEYCIDAGGDMLHSGKEPSIVGLENPTDSTSVIGTIPIRNQSICASAGNRRKWDKYHHTLNPKTLSSPDVVIATWVIAKKAQIADALTTCLILNPHLDLYQDYEFECLLLYKNYSVEKTPGFTAELFTTS